MSQQGTAGTARELVARTEDVGQHAQLLAGRAHEVHRRSDVVATDTGELAVGTELADAVERLADGVADSTAALCRHLEGADAGELVARGVSKLKRDLKRHTRALAEDAQLLTQRSLRVAKKSGALARRARLVDGHARRLALETQALTLQTRALADDRDLDARGQLESELRAENHQLAELNRLKTELLHSVSHESRTPLTSIQGYTEFLEDNLGGELTPRQADFVSQIKRGVDRLEQHVDDLLDFSRLEGGAAALALHPTPLGALIRSVVTSLEPAIHGAGLTFELRLASEAPDARVDSQRIEQVVFNLVGNAIKFSKPGGVIRIRTTYAGGSHLCEVEDAGIGIAADDIPRLFQRFTQLAGGLRLGLGAGLGLNISRKLIEAHHGEIGVRSELGCGSTFWFRLPQG